jgi:hypothetical protein
MGREKEGERMIISRKRFEQIVSEKVEEQRRRDSLEREIGNIYRELNSEVGRLEMMIRKLEGQIHEKS